MVTVRWNPQVQSVSSGSPNAAPVASAEANSSAAIDRLQKIRLQRRGARPLEFNGVHLLRLAGDQSSDYAPHYHADVYQVLEGGYAVAVNQSWDGEDRPVAVCTVRNVAEVEGALADIDPMVCVPHSVVHKRLSLAQDVPMAKAELADALVQEIRASFRSLLSRLSGPITQAAV